MGNIVEKVDVNTYLAAEQDVKVKLSAYIWCILSCKAQQVSAKDKDNLSSYFDYELDDELMFKRYKETPLSGYTRACDNLFAQLTPQDFNVCTALESEMGEAINLENMGTLFDMLQRFSEIVYQVRAIQSGVDSEDIKRENIKASVVNYYMAHFDEMGQDYATYTEYLTETIDKAKKAGADSALVKPLIHAKELLQRLHTEYSEIFKQVRGES